MTFIIVRYGANEEKLVNPNVLSASLLSYIKKSCGYTDLVENIDLASESGEVIDLVSKPKEYAKKFLEARGVYILVKSVGDDSEEASASYVPLLDSAGDKIKFSVTNPTLKIRTKGKPTKDTPAKTQDKVDPEPVNPIPNQKNAKQTAPAKKGGNINDSAKPQQTNNSTGVSVNNTSATAANEKTNTTGAVGNEEGANEKQTTKAVKSVPSAQTNSVPKKK